MKIIEKENEIILREIPVIIWLNSLLFLGFSAVSILFIKDAIKYPVYTFGLESGWFTIILNILWFIFMIIICCIMLVLGIFQIMIPMRITRIKLNPQTVDVTAGRLFFIKKTERFYFSQISSFEVENKGSDKKNEFILFLRLINGSRIELESDGSKKDSVFELRGKLNKLLNKPQNI